MCLGGRWAVILCLTVCVRCLRDVCGIYVGSCVISARFLRDFAGFLQGASWVRFRIPRGSRDYSYANMLRYLGDALYGA